MICVNVYCSRVVPADKTIDARAVYALGDRPHVSCHCDVRPNAVCRHPGSRLSRVFLAAGFGLKTLFFSRLAECSLVGRPVSGQTFQPQNILRQNLFTQHLRLNHTRHRPYWPSTTPYICRIRHSPHQTSTTLCVE